MDTFFKWLNRQAAVQDKQPQYFSKLQKIWQAALQKDLPEVDIDQAWSRVQQQIQDVADSTTQTSFIRRQPAFAALALLIIMTGIFSSVYFFLRPQTFIYQTRAAQTLHVILPDSSEVVLNAASQIIFKENFKAEQRHLILQGEALFHVQKDSLPFVISAGNTAIRVVGTTFNVFSRDDVVRVGVKEGIVEFSNSKAASDSVVRLYQGRQSWSPGSSPPVAARILNTQLFPDWLYNKLSCKQTSFAEVCRELERRFDTSIIIKDEQVKTVNISGLFEAQELEPLLKTICVLVNKDYRYEKDTIIIY